MPLNKETKRNQFTPCLFTTKTRGHIGRNVVNITIKMKTIVRKPIFILTFFFSFFLLLPSNFPLLLYSALFESLYFSLLQLFLYFFFSFFSPLSHFHFTRFFSFSSLLSLLLLFLPNYLAQSVGAVEYTDCFSSNG